jgi:recombination protein RecT
MQTATATKPAAQTAAPPKSQALTMLDHVHQTVLTPERREEIRISLPAHIPLDRYERNVANAFMANPDLLKCDPALVFREIAALAGLGLLLDPQLGEAYLIIGWNARTQRNEPQRRVGYRGLIKLARQSGDVKQVYAHEVCQNDKLVCKLGTEKVLEHEPNVFGDRGPIVGYYAVVKYTDGTTDFEPMSIADVHAIRDRSDAWKAFKAGKIKSTPWGTDETEMAKKTVMRRLCKRVPQSPELAEALAIEDRAEGYLVEDRPAAPVNAKSELDRFAGKTIEGEAIRTDQKPAQQQSSGPSAPIEVEEPGEDGAGDPPTESGDDEPVEDIVVPDMPASALKAWTDNKRWMEAWKWLSMTAPAIDPSARRALIDRHQDVLRACASYRPANKATVADFLSRMGCEINDL